MPNEPMAQACALLPGLSGVDLVSEMRKLYEFSVDCILEFGVLDQDDGDIALEKLYEIQHFITAVQHLVDEKDLEQRLAGTELVVLGDLGELSVDDFVHHRYRQFVPYYAILSHIMRVQQGHPSPSPTAKASIAGKELLVSTYRFSPEECRRMDPQGRGVISEKAEAIIHVATNADRSRTIVSDSVIPF